MPIWGLFAIAIARPGAILGCRVANRRKSELFVPHGWRRGLVVPSTFLLAIATLIVPHGWRRGLVSGFVASVLRRRRIFVK